jgi:hypothetical protein
MKKTAYLFLIFLILIGCKQGEKLTSPDHYILRQSVSEIVKVNTPAEFRIEILPTDGYEMEVEAPINLKFATENYPDLIFDKVSFSKKDLNDIKRPVFSGKITPKKAGEYNIKGELSFVVCTSTICEPKKTDINLHIKAE